MAYHVLIVDDNKHNRFTLTSLLGSISIDSYEAEDGAEALTCLMRYKVDLIILDIQLPDYNGFDLAKIIKKRKSTMAIPIIFATAIFKSDEFINKGFALGAVDYILKPINMEMFLSKIKYYKMIYDERKELIRELSRKNHELEKNIESLQLSDVKLKQSEENWKMLGLNIPYLVEVYSYTNDLVFSNNSQHNQKLKDMCLQHSQLVTQIIQTSLKGGKNLSERVTVNEANDVVHYEISSIIMGAKEAIQCMIIAKDVTLQQLHEEGIAYVGYHDQLTGLWNRHYFNEYIDAMNYRDKLPITIMMADVNGLKVINDSFGHKSGDDLIKAAAKCLTEGTPRDAVIARWGGDEFIILLPNTADSDAQIISDQIFQKMNAERVIKDFPVSIAIGFASNEADKFELEALIKDAENKMYVNKIQDQSSYRSIVVESLKKALFEQDYETEEHTERIGRMAMLLAVHLGLPQNDKDKLTLLGSLHDIGKIAISQTILSQKEGLSEADWLSIKRHPEIGFRICSGVPELSSIAELILSHHEKWDGSGYPRGLKGTEIPMLARMISILDTFDVITHDRPYKSKQSPQWALKELKRCAGTQFDPNLVNVFEHVYESMGIEELI